MSRFSITRTNIALPDADGMAGASDLLFRALDGFGIEDRASWRRFWKRMIGMKPGDMVEVEMMFPRSGPFHRRHMKIEQTVFDMQDKFKDREQFRFWLKVGAGWVDWIEGENGIVPLPKSISYAMADQDEFMRYHAAVIQFLRGPHAASFLWPHLEDKAHQQIDYILDGFNE